MTTEAGLFRLPSLPVGPYTVRAELQGFRPMSRTKNLLTVGADLNLAIVLEPGGINEAVVVTGETSPVQTTESSLSTLVSRETIVTLPLNGRNPLHLIGLVPGVVGHSAEATASGGTATHYINGDRGRGITTTQDGIDISDPVIPRGELTNAPVNPDALQEFRVITSNAKAEYGPLRRRAGRARDPQRNEHASAAAFTDFLRNTSLDSNSYFNKRQGLEKEVLERHQFGGGLGGPIQKDKAFFFVNYEGMRRTQETSQLVTVPTAALRSGIFRFVTQTCPGIPSREIVRRAWTRLATPSCPCRPTASSATIRGSWARSGHAGGDARFLPPPNDFSIGDGLNTAGYRWNSPSESPVDSLTTRIDVHDQPAIRRSSGDTATPSETI